jgi:hypothetical protein
MSRSDVAGEEKLSLITFQNCLEGDSSCPHQLSLRHCQTRTCHSGSIFVPPSLVLPVPLCSLSSGSIQLSKEATSSIFCSLVRAIVRGEVAVVRISRISRVLLHLLLCDVSSHAAPDRHLLCYKLNIFFARTNLGASPPCNIVFARHGTPAQLVEAVCRDGPRAFRTTDGGFFGAGVHAFGGNFNLLQLRANWWPCLLSKLCRWQFLGNIAGALSASAKVLRSQCGAFYSQRRCFTNKCLAVWHSSMLVRTASTHP